MGTSRVLAELENIRTGIQNDRTALMYLLIIPAMSLAFLGSLVPFLRSLYTQEIHAIPVGINRAQILPVRLAKGLPIILICLGRLCLLRNNKRFDQLIPFLAGTGILLLTYPTVAYEYNIPTLLGFVPLVCYWTKQDPIPLIRAPIWERELHPAMMA